MICFCKWTLYILFSVAPNIFQTQRTDSFSKGRIHPLRPTKKCEFVYGSEWKWFVSWRNSRPISVMSPDCVCLFLLFISQTVSCSNHYVLLSFLDFAWLSITSAVIWIRRKSIILASQTEVKRTNKISGEKKRCFIQTLYKQHQSHLIWLSSSVHRSLLSVHKSIISSWETQ